MKWSRPVVFETFRIGMMPVWDLVTPLDLDIRSDHGVGKAGWLMRTAEEWASAAHGDDLMGD